MDLGHFGCSFLEVLILSERWAGHGLLSEKVTRPHERVHRHISISSVPVSERIAIMKGFQIISSLMRALGKLPGGIGRFLPCGVGSHMSRLRHLGWAQCSHGLTSRPLESCHHQCLQAVCGVLGYPRKAAMELPDGTLELRHCTRLLSNKFPLEFTSVGRPPGVGKRFMDTPCNLLDCGGNVGKRARLTRKTRLG